MWLVYKEDNTKIPNIEIIGIYKTETQAQEIKQIKEQENNSINLFIELIDKKKYRRLGEII